MNTSSPCTSSALLTLQGMPFCVLTYREILQWLWTNWHQVSRITNWNSNLAFLRHIAGQTACIKETMFNLRLKLFHWRFLLLIQFATCLFRCKCHKFWNHRRTALLLLESWSIHFEWIALRYGKPRWIVFCDLWGRWTCGTFITNLGDWCCEFEPHKNPKIRAVLPVFLYLFAN